MVQYGRWIVSDLDTRPFLQLDAQCLPFCAHAIESICYNQGSTYRSLMPFYVLSSPKVVRDDHGDASGIKLRGMSNVVNTPASA